MTAPDLLNPETRPETIHCRADEQALLHATVADPAEQHRYVHVPRGAGKTLLVRDALTTAAPATAYYLSCIPYDTQYKVLEHLCERAADTDLNPGYHTAQLQQRLAQHLRDTTTIIVLDDLAFLLANDGNDLLYFLSRLDPHGDLCIIGIGTDPALLTNLDDRTYSSLPPQPLSVEPYTADEVVRILNQRVGAALPPDTVTPAALEHIAATTANLTLALHWLTCAAAEAADITVDVLQAVADAAVARYQAARLREFTWHHTALLEAIDQLADTDEGVFTGEVYDRYAALCRTSGKRARTPRRTSDFLTHLELLGLIDVTHHDGGPGAVRDAANPLDQQRE